MKSKSFLAFSLSLFCTSFAHAGAIADDVGDTLRSMRSVYRATYAPTAWKKKQVGYDLEAEFKTALDSVAANPDMTVEQARPVFKQFIYSMADYHTSIQFASTEKASLPFVVKSAGDRYFIVYIDRQKLSEKAFPFRVGDELMTLDGRAVKDAVADLEKQTVANVPETDRALATIALTNRTGVKGYSPIPHGPVVVGVKAKGQTKVQELQLIWDYAPERATPRMFASGHLASERSNIFDPMMDVSVMNDSVASPYDIGAKKTYTPDLGAKIWEAPADNAFHAYIYRTPERQLIGYLRLPGYVQPNYNKSATDFQTIVKQFESLTDGMIIDQVNNPGGSVFYLYALASMLTDQPLKTPRHMMTVTQQDVIEAADLADKLRGVKNDADAAQVLEHEDMHGYPVTYQVARFQADYANFLMGEWSAGRRLTTPYWIGGVDRINPSPVHYTKPILVLINNLDFSGGDFFPTILQDNQRATIMGSRTAGAGGYVREISLPNDVGITKFRTTASLAERVSGNPIENLGVTPDVPYELTVDDLQNNYAPYARAVNAQILKMTK